MATVLDFYRFASPRGTPVKKLATWNTSTTPTITLTPASNQAYFIKTLSFLIDENTDFGANSVTMTHTNDVFGGAESTALTFASIDQLIAGFSPGTVKTVGFTIKGHIVFDVPIRLQNSASESFTIAYGGSGLTGGTLYIAASGWYITPESDL